MRKNRFCTFTLIASLVIAALPATLAAAGTGGGTSSLPVQQDMTLTITPSGSVDYDPEGSSFTAYRVMSFTQNATSGNWVWAVTNGFTYPGTGTFDADALGAYPASKLQDLAQKLSLQVTDSMQDKLAETQITDGSVSWTTDKAGIYLVCETKTAAGNFPSKPFLVALPYTDDTNDSSWQYSLTAHPKGSKVELQKVIQDAKGSYLNTAGYDGSKDIVASGDVVSYRISTRIPNYTEVYFENGKNPTFRLTDTMAKGLTLMPASIRLVSGEKTLTKDTDYTQTIDTDQNGITTLVIALKSSYLSVEDNQNKEIVLYCNATVNDHVSLADDGNDNVVKLDYSYDPTDPTKTEEIEKKATVYSFGIEVEKFDGDSDSAQKVKLSGAQFELYKETTKGCSAAQALSQEPYRTVQETGANGIADFKGLDAGTYYLKEVKAPHGYSLLMNPIKVEIIPSSISAANEEAEVIDSGAFTVKVNGTLVPAEGVDGITRILDAANREGTVVVAAANHKGFSLPMTGGTGIAVILLISLSGLAVITCVYLRGGRGKDTGANGHLA